jgi:hypothetical protein
MLRIAFPNAIFGEIADFFRAAFRAFYLTVQPAQLHHKLSAMFEIREVENGIAECSMCAHELSMRPKVRYVKYIIAHLRGSANGAFI